MTPPATLWRIILLWYVAWSEPRALKSRNELGKLLLHAKRKELAVQVETDLDKLRESGRYNRTRCLVAYSRWEELDTDLFAKIRKECALS